MATGLKDDTDNRQATDEHYNPSGAARELYGRETDDSVFDDIAKNYDKTADDSQENANIEKAKSANGNRDDAKDAEEQPSWVTNITGRGQYGGSPTQSGRALTPMNMKAILRKKGPLGLLVALLFGGGVVLTGFGAPAMLLMQITDVLTNNFNDAHTSLAIRTNANIGHKINSTRNSFAETADGKCGILCKHTTMSDSTVRNLIANGFDISPKPTEDNRKFNRYVVQTLTFPDGTTVNNGNEFKAALKNPVRIAAFNNVFNSKTRYFLNSKFGQTLRSKLGLNKAYKLAGDTKQKFNESFRRSLGLPAVAPTIDPNSTPQQQLVAANPKLQATVDAISRLTNRPNNVVEIACLAYNTSRAIDASLKIAKYTQYAAFAMTFMNAAHKLKAGDQGGIDPLVVSELGAILTYIAMNKTNADGSNNELYGLSATDSYGYKAAAYGDSGALPNYAKRHSLQTTGLLGSLTALATFPTNNKVARDSASNACRTSDSIFATALQCLASGPGIGVCIVGQEVTGAIVGGIMAAAMPELIKAVVATNLSDISNYKGALAGDIMYPGAAAILGGHAESYGMKAGKKAEIKNYIALGNEVREQDIAVAKLEAKEAPFDVSNQYSFLGSMARNVNLAALTNANLTTGAARIGSLIPKSLATLTTNSSAGTYMPVAENKANQYGNPECASLNAIGVDGDQYCMPAFVKSAEELNADIEANLNFMYNNEYINGDTGAPRLDTANGREFQKFLDNCAFRTEPRGETTKSLMDGDVGDYEWFIGANCDLDTSANGVEDNVKNFRIYTMDEPINAEFDDEESVLKSSTTPASTPQAGSNGAGENSGNVDADGWAFPTTAGAPLTQGYHDGHLALDIGSDPNQASVPIYAMREGTVLSVGNMPMPPYQVACASPTGTTQQAVLIEHNVNGVKYVSTYHHVMPNEFPFAVGATVKAGDRIATMGNTGCSFGRHLHVELWRNSVHGGGTTEDLGAILYG